ncbi:phosphopantetheine-binding protein [Hydrogenimonas thermophila]|uniref:phosphopantetheine-binding protein n=1 Tax=Hydrogenimonas thermophila TaxID=223786 RepID=UPI002936F582|nr:phosphopantetheine-binding protein [Hydrogenimonas thermophila]WOE69609.1 phosphopantetheine-binding protein [Hydrogenimonas thermophila]WOE72123.1 phosphopantetheine-binding protein [Hydrogenimonas thermophila]
MITTSDLKQAIIDGLNLEDMSIDEIDDESPLFGSEGLGLDSVDAIELTLILEKNFSVKITNMSDVENIFSSIKALTHYINEQRQ